MKMNKDGPTSSANPIIPNDEIAHWLNSAVAQIGKSGCDVDMPDVIAHADCKHLWPCLRGEILHKLKLRENMPDGVEIVELPKDRLTVRPLARLEFDARVSYEAAVFAMTQQIDKTISNSVYSYRYTSTGKFQHPVRAWVRMQRYARALHQERQGVFMARTDIASFFENIDPSTMLEDLEGMDVPNWALSYLEKFIYSFNKDSNARGLPQGTNASQVLANLYLAPLDANLETRGVEYLRYSDDLYLFGSSFTQLREVLLEVTRTLRHRKLSISGAKTQIYEEDDVDIWIDGINKDALSYDVSESVAHEFSLGSEKIGTCIRDEFERAVQNPARLDTRSFKFCLTQMAKLDDDYAVGWVLHNLSVVPHAAKEIVRYLRNVNTNKPIYDRLSEILGSAELRPYPYAQQHILIHLMQQPYDVHRQAIDNVWNIFSDRNNMGYVREMAARLIGKRGNRVDYPELKRCFDAEQNARVRRALLVACYESGPCTSDLPRDVLSRSEDDLLRRTARYLLDRPIDIPTPQV